MGKKIEGVTPRQLNILEKKGITTYEDILNLLPRDYIDLRERFTSFPALGIYNGKSGYVQGVLVDYFKKKAKTGAVWTKIKIRMSGNNSDFYVTSFGKYDIEKNATCLVGKEVAVFGTLTFDEYGYSMKNPMYLIDVCNEDLSKYARLMPVYTKIAGISENTMNRLRTEALGESYSVSMEEMPQYLEVKHLGHSLMPLKQAYQTIHYPADTKELAAAIQKLDSMELWNYAVALEKQDTDAPRGTILNVRNLSVVKEIIKSLPYELTNDQKRIVNAIVKEWRLGKRVESLIQGDVGCGKTMVAILLLFVVASNGGQALITAPTEILAEQHYEEIKTYGERFRIPVAYLGGNTKVKDKRTILAGLADGSIGIVVGTQSLCNNKVVFKNLQLSVIDEEHRFGVEQKDSLSRFRNSGSSVVKMSATPIPRTLASALYGTGTNIYSIRTMPSGRSPIQTAICKSDKPVFSFLEKELAKGHQAYIVCPLVEESDSEVMEGVVSVEQKYIIYKEAFRSKYEVGLLHGKMKKDEMEEIIERFKRNEIQILVSTTVVEVGVNVPNATVIAISNAERFGLASLHQLRGRVGRGQAKGYCILQSPIGDKCERLNVLTSTTDGFVVSEADAKLRGNGDLVGTMQSGTPEIALKILKNELIYHQIRKAAKEYCDDEDLFDELEESGIDEDISLRQSVNRETKVG